VFRRCVAALMMIAGAALLPGTALHAQIVRAAWLAGCWEARSGTSVVEEDWMAPRGRTMLSMGRTVHLDTLVDFEQVVLREKDGRLEYEMHPFNQQVGVFMSTQLTETSLVFENPLHDFPQRIGYTRRGSDSLIAWIDGRADGKSRRVEFPYAKVTCGM
jgi:Domain of unknown function (DUF6265)